MRASIAVVLLAGCTYGTARRSSTEYTRVIGANVALARDSSAEIDARAGQGGLAFTGTASLDRVEDEAHTERRLAAALTVGMSLSLSAITNEGRADRLLDLGFDTGFGLGLSRDGELSKAYAGAWTEVGFGGQSGPAIRLALRRVGYHEWANETLVLVGLQWVKRHE